MSISNLLIRIKCWIIRVRYSSQLLNDDTFYNSNLWHPMKVSNKCYRYVGKGLYYEVKNKAEIEKHFNF